MEINQESSSKEIKIAKNIYDEIKKDITGEKDMSAYLIPILQKIQSVYGYLPIPALTWLSKQTKIPTSRMYGVITFYQQFHTKPHGKITIRCCHGTACHVKGGKRVYEAIQKELGVEGEGTTEDMHFTIESVACLGTCFLAPVIMIGEEYHGELTPARIPEILEKFH